MVGVSIVFTPRASHDAFAIRFHDPDRRLRTQTLRFTVRDVHRRPDGVFAGIGRYPLRVAHPEQPVPSPAEALALAAVEREPPRFVGRIAEANGRGRGLLVAVDGPRPQEG